MKKTHGGHGLNIDWVENIGFYNAGSDCNETEIVGGGRGCTRRKKSERRGYSVNEIEIEHAAHKRDRKSVSAG